MRVAAIDIGTNSVLLLIAETQTGAEQASAFALRPILEKAQITRLGQGVDATRALAPDAVERTLACLAAYGDAIREASVDRVDVVGTSAMRDARGGEDFVRRATALLGVAPRTISGEEEAVLTFEGALQGLALPEASGRDVDMADVMVIDVGGGSTELVRGARNMRNVTAAAGAGITFKASINVGSVRLFERFIRTDPPSAAESAAARAFVLEQLGALPAPPAGLPLVGIAGTVTTLAAVARGINPYDGARVHGVHLSAQEVADIAKLLSSKTVSERKLLAGVDPKRADVIAVGAIIVDAILDWAKAPELIASDRGVRWGLALSLAS